MDLYVYGDDASGTFRYTVKGSSRERSGNFRQEAPGHYRANLPITASGVYRIEVVEMRDDKKLIYPPIGYTQAQDPSAEIPRDRFNFELLEAVAGATGGQINARIETKLPAETLVRSTTPLQMVPILAAAALFLFEVFVRRFALS